MNKLNLNTKIVIMNSNKVNFKIIKFKTHFSLKLKFIVY